ncbi:uncharacterized protein METZ01_LOCUS112234 [marine metagenome]|uniref:Uncharacterized protein n=1 Tax=marine metagenome TaxID=408172 RepID=A0A381X418_9ZZZZ|tara:strand:+ start:244 stop:1194 length:951 start_codon:yes stop_codon:yes gene_type:complete
MRIKNKLLSAVLFGLTALVAFTVQAQSTDTARFLSLSPPDGLPIIPVLEGWIANPNGTTSFSFGIINRNDDPVDIPIGENNYIEPAKYDGMQATHFPAGRTTGAFAVTVPSSEQNDDVWWYLKTGDSESLKVPGRRGASAYELDFILPRPQGALQPLVGIGEDGPQTAPAVGLVTMIDDYPRNPVGVGQQVLLTINATDPAVRDPEDPRFGEPLAMGVSFTKFQGPGDVEFTMHPDNETDQENPYSADDPRSRFFRPPGPNQLEITGPSGVGQVYASFSEPGEYIIWTKVDVHKAPDSSNGDQCCWTNVYQRVSVQ